MDRERAREDRDGGGGGERENERVARVTKMDYSKIHGSEPSGF